MAFTTKMPQETYHPHKKGTSEELLLIKENLLLRMWKLLITTTTLITRNNNRLYHTRIINTIISIHNNNHHHHLHLHAEEHSEESTWIMVTIIRAAPWQRVSAIICSLIICKLRVTTCLPRAFIMGQIQLQKEEDSEEQVVVLVPQEEDNSSWTKTCVVRGRQRRY